MKKKKYQTKIEAFDAKTLSLRESNPDHARDKRVF